MRKSHYSHLLASIVLALLVGFSSCNMDQQKPTDPMSTEYWKDWNSDVQARIDRDIEQFRKADAVLKIEGLRAGTEVKVEQVSHDFQFGANIFNFNQLGSTELNNRYKEIFGTLFNSATIPFYWNNFEREPGKPRYLATHQDSEDYWNGLKEPWKEKYWRRPAPEKIIEFCESKDIHMHGHPLIYANFLPSWISREPDRVGEVERLIEKHITEIGNYYEDRIPSWDIVNESVEPVPGEMRWGILPDDYTFKSYKLAEKVFPASVLLNINDSWRKVYPPFIQDLIDRGAKIDVVGLQMHIFDFQSCQDIAAGKTVYPNNTSWKPQDVIDYLEQLDSLGRPIHLSEISIPSPGDDTTADEIQAIITRNMYRLWFSWPSIYRITWWNVVDDCGYRGEPTSTGLFTRNMEPKPSFLTLDSLINDEWKTRTTVETDENGIAKFRGFKGKYVVSWKDKAGKEQKAEFYLKNNGDGFERNL